MPEARLTLDITDLEKSIELLRGKSDASITISRTEN